MAFNPMTVNTPPEAAPHIYAEDDAAVFQSIFGGDGILSVGSRFKTEVKTNNLVRLNDGVLCVGGHLGRIKYADYEDCVIENGETGYNRNDLIIGSFSNNGEHTIDEMKIEVLKGKVTTGTAEDPVVTQGDLYEGEQLRQVPIARVKLEGLNIVSVDMLLPVIPTIPMINMYLSDKENPIIMEKIVKTPGITLNAFEGKALSSSALTPPTVEGYKCIGLASGWGDGQIGLLVSPNGWVANCTNVKKTYNAVTLKFLYLKTF